MIIQLELILETRNAFHCAPLQQLPGVSLYEPLTHKGVVWCRHWNALKRCEICPSEHENDLQSLVTRVCFNYNRYVQTASHLLLCVRRNMTLLYSNR